MLVSINDLPVKKKQHMLDVHTFIKKHVEARKPLLLGLSGGPDSLCLLYLLLEEYREYLHIVHVDHGWRPESLEECQTLANLAKSLKIPFHTTRLDPSKFTGNLEAASRTARYDFFKSIANSVGAQTIILGHQADDVSETVFKRMLEGASFASFGVAKVRKEGDLTILRPLLMHTKIEVIAWLEERNIPFFTDPTNLQKKYLRGRLRSEIFPYLRNSFGKAFERSLCHLGSESEELRAFLEEEAAKFKEKSIVGPWGTYFPEMPASSYLFKHLLKPGFSREQLQLAVDIIQLPNKQIHTASKSLYIDRGRLFMTHGVLSYTDWQITVRQVAEPKVAKNHFTDIWRGYATTYLPLDAYTLMPARSVARSEAKAPAFLSAFVPAATKDGVVLEDFLSGKKHSITGPCIEIILSLQQRK